MFVDELVAVAVARIDERFRFGKGARKGADQIVRLIARFFQDADTHGGKQFFEDGHLYHKVLRHGFARCLIVRIHFMAESGLVYVESNNEISWLFVLKDFEEQLDKAEDPVGRKPVLGGKNRHCIVCAV